MKLQLICLLIICSNSLYAQQNVAEADTLNGDNILLDEVVVNAPQKTIQSRGLGNMRINSKVLHVSPLFFGERDVIKTLQFLPGVSGGMEGSSQLNIRGGTNDQTLYLMDGVPVYNQNHTFGLFSIFNADVVNTVDLYKGGIPASYGDRLSGVVSVELKDGDTKNHHHSVSIGLLAGTLSSEGPIIEDKLSYLFVARRSFLDLLYEGVMMAMGQGDGGMAMIKFYDVNAKLTWSHNPKNKISWQLFSGYDDLYGMNREENEYDNEKYKESFGYGWNSLTTSLHYDSELKSNLSLKSNIYYTGLKNFNYNKSKFKSPMESMSTHNETASLMNEFGGRASLLHRINYNNTTNYGIEVAHQDYTPDHSFKKVNKDIYEFSSPGLSLFKASAFAYHEYSYKRWLFGAGLRASYYKNSITSKTVLEPRLKVNTFVDDKNKLMIAYDRMSQPIHTINEVDYNSKSDYWIPFHGEILPYSDQLSAGWKNYTTPWFSYSVELYYKRMHNLLFINDVEYFIDYNTDYLQGSGTSKGVELMAEYSRNRLTAWASYTLTKTDRIFDGKTVPFKYDSPHDVSLFASYVLKDKSKAKHSISAQVQFKNGYPYSLSPGSYPGMGLPMLPSGYGWDDRYHSVDFLPNTPNGRLNNYFRTDLNYTVDRKMNRGSLIWQFSLLNATNNKNPFAVYKKDDSYKAFVLIPTMPSISVRRVF
ncbi:MAG: TonB-dependent receptor plug domain-containing protein [Fermentimonas sp.]|nr:TonB-dependent receptor plug domain-containing protein [Fermentimonas sp.]MDD4008361.1 TonB-dependent receptor plug domain-containing protein [Fermentimonas sp.]MDD4696442.1 TonB-dependent receptor plug domain-containing protein [Fermentimonas sp.]